MKMNSNRRSVTRTCVSCRQTGDKRTMVRLVRSPEGCVTLDERGRLPGRGAYLCLKTECWQAALKSNCLEHGLRTSLAPEDKARLMAAGQALIGGS